MLEIRRFVPFLALIISSWKCSYQKNIYKNVIDKIMTDYDPGLRPVSKLNTTINVSLTFGIIQLLNVGDVTKTVQVVSYTILNWHDEHLTWNPEQFDNVTSFRFPHKRVWKPDIILTNTPDLNEGPIMNQASTNVDIYSDGSITNEYIAVYTATCHNMDMTNFPFDHHICYFDFASWTYNMDELDIDFAPYEYDLPYSMKQVPNAEWDVNVIKSEKLTEVECCPNQTYPTIRIHVSLTRKPLYFMVNIIIPTTITCYIAFIGMFNPSSSTGERNEKAFLGITTLLAVSLLMLTVSSQMPVTSTSVPLMGYFLGVYIITIALAIICTEIIMHIDINGLHGQPLPKWARKWFLEILGQWLFVYKSIPFSQNEPKENLLLSKPIPPSENSSHTPILMSLLQTTVKHRYEKRQYNAVRNEWSQLATVLDRICLILFIIWSTIFTIIILAHYR